MMGQNWLVSAFLFMIFELAQIPHTEATTVKTKSNQSNQKAKTLPLAKSFGMTRLNQESDEDLFGQEFIAQYQDMLKASQESFESFGDQGVRRLRRVIGDNEFGMMADAGGSNPHRRSAPRFQPQAVKRRTRSQHLRRNILNSQGLKSHLAHTHHDKQDYDNL